MGGLAAALDTTAGERERQSLEPLLMTPARPMELVVGKWVAVVLFNALVVVITLAGFYLTLTFAPLPPVGAPFLFSAREFGRFLVVLLPTMLLVPAVLLYVGSRGRTFKEAQANVSVLLFVVSLAAGRPDLPAAEGAGLAGARAGVRPVHAAEARAARRGDSVVAARAVVRGARRC